MFSVPIHSSKYKKFISILIPSNRNIISSMTSSKFCFQLIVDSSSTRLLTFEFYIRFCFITFIRAVNLIKICSISKQASIFMAIILIFLKMSSNSVKLPLILIRCPPCTLNIYFILQMLSHLLPNLNLSKIY